MLATTAEAEQEPRKTGHSSKPTQSQKDLDISITVLPGMDAELGELALINFCPGLEVDLKSSSCCLCSLSFPTWEMEVAPRISKY